MKITTNKSTITIKQPDNSVEASGGNGYGSASFGGILSSASGGSKPNGAGGGAISINPKTISVTFPQTDKTTWEMKEDLETEKLITGKNLHSVYHICPKHGVGIDMPLQNDCVDCKLYLSGKDIRQLLAQALDVYRGKLIKRIKQNMVDWRPLISPERQAGIEFAFKRALTLIKEEE